VKHSELVNIMKEVESFPSMPGAAAKVLSLLDDPEVSASQIEEALRYDPGLTANILKMTNSSYFGMASEVGSLKRAVVVLGIKRVLQIVIASCVNAMMSKSVMGYDLPPGELWKHSITVSIAAEGLVQELSISAAGEIFTAALLHDIGKLVLGAFVKDDLEKIERLASDGMPFQEAERNVLGTDHAETGANILRQWSFPQEIVNAVRWHHEPDTAEEQSTLLDILYAADILSMQLGTGLGREGLHFETSPSVEKRLGLENHHVDAVSSRTLEWAKDLSEVLNPNIA